MMSPMTRKLREILEQAETWPEEAQEELADAALELLGPAAEPGRLPGPRRGSCNHPRGARLGVGDSLVA